MPYATRLSTAFLSHVENKNEEADKELRHLHCLSPGISWSINWTATAFHIFFVVQGGGRGIAALQKKIGGPIFKLGLS